MRIVNRMKATLARLGIRNFKPTLRKAAERLATLHTPEGIPLPPNGLAELQRDMARLGFVISQIKEIEEARQKRLEQEPESGPHAMVRHLARVVGVGIETADMLVHEVLSRPMRDRFARNDTQELQMTSSEITAITTFPRYPRSRRRKNRRLRGSSQ
jgi:transposase